MAVTVCGMMKRTKVGGADGRQDSSLGQQSLFQRKDQEKGSPGYGGLSDVAERVLAEFRVQAQSMKG